MLVAVVGGTGTVGREVVVELVQRGHEVRQLSRRPPQRATLGVVHRSVDLTTDADISAALADVEAVVDAANSTSSPRRTREVLVEGTRRIGVAAAAAGVGHHVLISIVGIEQIPVSYYRAKVAQEDVLEQGQVPWSVVRATQFHDLLDQWFSLAARVGVLPTARFAVQPVDARAVARVLADAVEAGPTSDRVEVGGPEVRSFGDLARIWRAATGRRALAVPVPLPGAVGRGLRRGALTAPDAALKGSPTFASWLEMRSTP